jgi:hypothetical protein
VGISYENFKNDEKALFGLLVGCRDHCTGKN